MAKAEITVQVADLPEVKAALEAARAVVERVRALADELDEDGRTALDRAAALRAKP